MLVCFQTLFILFWIFSYCVDLKHFCLERGVLCAALERGILYLSSETDHSNVVTSICWQVHRVAILVLLQLPRIRELKAAGSGFALGPALVFCCCFFSSDFPHVSVEHCYRKAYVHIFLFKFLISLGRITWLWIIALCLKMSENGWWLTVRSLGRRTITRILTVKERLLSGYWVINNL